MNELMEANDFFSANHTMADTSMATNRANASAELVIQLETTHWPCGIAPQPADYFILVVISRAWRFRDYYFTKG